MERSVLNRSDFVVFQGSKSANYNFTQIISTWHFRLEHTATFGEGGGGAKWPAKK